MYCHQCGKEIGEGKFCPYCGTSLTTHQNIQGYQPINQQTISQQDGSSFSFAVLSFFIPVVGFILYLVWHKELPLKAKSCLKGFILGIVFYVVLFCIVIASFFSMISNNTNDYPYKHHYEFEQVEYMPCDKK